MIPALSVLVQAGILPLPDAERIDRSLDPVAARAHAEQLLTDAFTRGLTAQQRRLLNELDATQGNPTPRALERLWAQEDELLWLSVQDDLRGVASEHGVRASINAADPNTWQLVNEEVVNWVDQRYTSPDPVDFGSIPNLNQVSRGQFADALQRWQLGDRTPDNYAQGLPQLINELQPIFGRARAIRIATTEVSRVFAQSELFAARANPFIVYLQWLTANDELVCPICGPRANRVVGKEDEDGFRVATDNAVGYPPAHVMCRCSVTQLTAPALAALQAEGLVEGGPEVVAVEPMTFGKLPPIIGDANPDVIRVFQEEFELLARDYPFLRDYVKGFDFTHVETGGGDWSNEAQMIRLSPSMAKSSLDEIRQAFKSDKIVGDGNVRNLVIHETGHAIDTYTKFGVGRNSSIQDEYFDALADLRQTLPSPSQYGSTNRAEWVAERFLSERLGLVNDRALENVFAQFIAQVDERNLAPEEPKRKGRR